MGQRIQIRSLVRQQSDTDDASGAAKLPSAIQESLPIWNIIAARSAEVLGNLLLCDVTAKVELSITTHAELRKSDRKPGLVLPLEPAQKHGIVRFPGDSAPRLADLLLRATSERGGEDDLPEELDGLISTQVVEAVSGLIYAAFGIPLRLPRKVEPVMIWPLTPPPPGERLCAEFKLSLPEGDPATVQFVFRDTQVHVFQDLLQRQTKHLELQSLEVPLTGVLGRWYGDAGELERLVPGGTIVIPGADLQRVAIEASAGERIGVVAHAELGTVRGRHALKVTDVEPK